MEKHVERLSLAFKDQYQRQHLKHTTGREQKKNDDTEDKKGKGRKSKARLR